MDRLSELQAALQRRVIGIPNRPNLVSHLFCGSDVISVSYRQERQHCLAIFKKEASLGEINGSGVKNIYLNKSAGNGVLVFGVFIFALFIASAYFILIAHQQQRTLSIVLGAAWVVGVPIYFFIEHVFNFRKVRSPPRNTTSSSAFKILPLKFGWRRSL